MLAGHPRRPALTAYVVNRIVPLPRTPARKGHEMYTGPNYRPSPPYLASGPTGRISRLYAAWHSSAHDRYAASAPATKPSQPPTWTRSMFAPYLPAPTV